MKTIFVYVSVFMSLAGASPALAGYSAIAYNSSTQVWGEGHGYGSSTDAINAAVSACGDGCVWLAWAENGCVALADNSAGDYGYSWGYDSASDATNAAINSCNSRGTGQCSWRVWACN